MSGRRLTPAEAEIVRNQVVKRLRYLHELRARMSNAGFAPRDPVYLAAVAAANAAQDLHVQLHYAASPNGTGQEPSK